MDQVGGGVVGLDLLRLKNQEVDETWKEILPCHLRKYLIPDVSPG